MLLSPAAAFQALLKKEKTNPSKVRFLSQLKHPISFFPKCLDRPAAGHRSDQADAENDGVPKAGNDVFVDQCAHDHSEDEDDGHPGGTQYHVYNKADPESKHSKQDNRHHKLQQAHELLDLLLSSDRNGTAAADGPLSLLVYRNQSIRSIGKLGLASLLAAHKKSRLSSASQRLPSSIAGSCGHLLRVGTRALASRTVFCPTQQQLKIALSIAVWALFLFFSHDDRSFPMAPGSHNRHFLKF